MRITLLLSFPFDVLLLVSFCCSYEKKLGTIMRSIWMGSIMKFFPKQNLWSMQLYFVQIKCQESFILIRSSIKIIISSTYIAISSLRIFYFSLLIGGSFTSIAPLFIWGFVIFLHFFLSADAAIIHLLVILVSLASHDPIQPKTCSTCQ